MRTVSGLTCSTACQLSINETDYECEPSLAPHNGQPILLKSPLPVLTNGGADDVVFCARVHPPEASVQWFVAGREIVANNTDEHNVNDSLVAEITKVSDEKVDIIFSN